MSKNVLMLAMLGVGAVGIMAGIPLLPYLRQACARPLAMLSGMLSRRQIAKYIVPIFCFCGLVQYAATKAKWTDPDTNYTWSYVVRGDEAEIFLHSDVLTPPPAISPFPEGFVAIPELLGGACVTRIGDLAFINCTDMTGVSIPDTVASIGYGAFLWCNTLTELTIPSSVTNIGHAAFCSCVGLTNIVFEGNAPKMGNNVFDDVASGCCAYVRRNSTGWGVDIPGTWNGIAIDYLAASDMSTAGVVLLTDSVAYNGGACEPGVASVIVDGRVLTDGVDYLVSYSDNTNAGTATITLAGVNLYDGTYTTNFTIRPKPLTEGMVEAIGNHPYTGKAQTPKPTVMDTERGATLREGVEYTISYANNTAIGEGIVTVTGKGNYTGSVARAFIIEPSVGSELEERLGDAGKAESDGSGGWIVTLTNDVDAADLPIEMPDDFGSVTIDLNGHDMIGPDGESGGSIETALPAIRIVPGDGEGNPTVLTVVTTGGDAIVQGGEGAPAIKVADGAQEGVLVNIGADVTVQGGGDDVVAIDGEIGESSGTIVKATYDMSGAAWNYSAPFTYDGTKRSVEVTGLPSGVTVASYEGNVATSPRTYTAHATFAYDAENYNEPSIADCRWTILPSDEWTGVDLTLGFEEYAQGTVLTEENCPALTLPTPNEYAEYATLTVFDNGGDIECAGGFAPPFASAGTNSLHIKTYLGHPCAFGFKENNDDVEVFAEYPCCVEFLARFTAFDEVYYLPRSAHSSLLSKGPSVAGKKVSRIKMRDGFCCSIDDSIRLWQLEEFDPYTDEPTGTNWCVTAGDGSGGVTNYVLTALGDEPIPGGDAAECDGGSSGWHRITFKACRARGSNSLFFNLFIGGRQVRAGDTTDFPSMTDGTSVSSLRFDGQGDVDNIAVCEEPDSSEEPGDGEVPEGGESKFDVTVMYDGEGHAIDANALTAAFGAAMGGELSCMYARAQDDAPAMPWVAEPPMFTNAGEYVVWYRVTNPNYEEFVHAAKVTVEKRVVTLTSGNAGKMYDGKPLTARSVVVGGDGFVDGEGATFDVTGSQTDVGSSANTFAYMLNDGTKAENYDITTVYGALTVAKAICTITFDANGGKGEEAQRQMERGCAIGLLPIPKRSGYTFSGWWTAKSGGSMITSKTKVTKVVTVYARWTANKYTIKFNANGGKGTMKALSATYGKSVKLTANAFKRSKHTFLGWAKTKSGAVVYKNKASVKNLTATDGKTVALYAVWKPYSYTVKFNANGGTGAAQRQEVVCGAKTKLAANAYKREGFVFAGWATKRNGPVVYKNKASVKDLAKKGETATLYAVWKPAKWAVGTFRGAGEVGGKAATATITVSSSGKISGKFVVTKGKKTYSFKAESFDGFSDGALRVTTPIKIGSKKCALEIAVGQVPAGSGVVTFGEMEATAGGRVYATAFLQ